MLLSFRSSLYIKDINPLADMDLQIQLTLEQHGFELHGSAYTWVFSHKCVLEQRPPTFLAPGTGFMEDNFALGVGRGDGSGSNASDGAWQMKLRSLTHRSLPAVRPSS